MTWKQRIACYWMRFLSALMGIVVIVVILTLLIGPGIAIYYGDSAAWVAYILLAFLVLCGLAVAFTQWAWEIDKERRDKAAKAWLKKMLKL